MNEKRVTIQRESIAESKSRSSRTGTTALSFVIKAENLSWRLRT